MTKKECEYGTYEELDLRVGDIVIVCSSPLDSVGPTTWDDPNARATIAVARIIKVANAIRGTDRTVYNKLAEISNDSDQNNLYDTGLGIRDIAGLFGNFYLLRRALEEPNNDEDRIYTLMSPDGVLPITVIETRRQAESLFQILAGGMGEQQQRLRRATLPQQRQLQIDGL